MSRVSLSDELSTLRSIRQKNRKNHSKTNSVAVVMASRRPDDLGDSLTFLRGQTLPTFELHLGLHGFNLNTSLKNEITKLRNRKIKVFVHYFDETKTLGEILTALAQGTTSRYISKMDDDDFYSSEHLHDLLDCIIAHGCEVVGKAMNYIYLEPLDLTVRRANSTGVSSFELFSDWVCGGTIMVERTAGEKVGWFGSGKSAVDTYLLQKVAKHGGKIWRTLGTGYIYRRRQGDHTYGTNFAKYLSGSSEQWVGNPKLEEFGIRK